MKKLGIFILSAAILVGLGGCSKIKEAKEAVQKASNVLDAAKSLSDSDVDVKELELTEASVGRYFSTVAKLNAKYPDIDFENAAAATIFVMASGKKIQEIVPAEGGMDYAEYAGLSASIMKAQFATMGNDILADMVPQIESSIQSLEATDTSAFTEEQKSSISGTIQEQKAKLAEMKETLDSQEYKDQMAKVEMIRKAKAAAGL